MTELRSAFEKTRRTADAFLGEAAQALRARGRFGRLPPGPIDPPALQLAQFLFQPKAYVRRCRDTFGTPFTMRFPGLPPIVQFCEPDAVRDVFTGSPEEFWAGEANFVLEPIVGTHSLLLLDGPRHQSQRRLLTPPFRGERMKTYGRAMRDVTEKAIDALPLDRPFRFHDLTQTITLDVILRTVFGVDEGPEMDHLRAELAAAIALGTRPELMVRRLQVDLGPRSPWRRFQDRVRGVRATILALVERRRREGASDRADVLSLLLAARHEDGTPMSDAELLDELITLLVAGHETTATALAWTAHRLVRHPESQARAAAELRAAFPDGAVDPERIGELAYLHAVHQEVLRIHPVVPGVGRVLHRDATIGGVKLPAGVVVTIGVVLAHELEQTFPEPRLYRPERFLERKFTPYEHVAFGGGVRRCIGMAFALYEMDVVMATILSRLELRAGSRERTRTVRRSVTLAPHDGVPIVARRRA